MDQPEFSRPVDLRHVQAGTVQLIADEAERAALARRLGLVSISRLEAGLALAPAGAGLCVSGTFSAVYVQLCAVSGDELSVACDEPMGLRFVPEVPVAEEELELEESQLDEVTFIGSVVDLGEAVAQSLSLAIDPYLTGPNADRVRKEKGLLDEGATGPFAALLGLKKGD